MKSGIEGGGSYGGRRGTSLQLRVIGLSHVGFSVVLRVLVLLEHLSARAVGILQSFWGRAFPTPVTIGAAPETLVYPALASTGTRGTRSSPAGTRATSLALNTLWSTWPGLMVLEKQVVLFGDEEGRDEVAVPDIVLLAVEALEATVQWVKEAEGGDDLVEVGVVGRNRHVLEADVGPLVARLKQDLCLRVPEVEGVSCLKVLGLERLRNVVADEAEGLHALFGGDRVIGVRRLNGALEFVGNEMGTDVEDQVMELPPSSRSSALRIPAW
ncbi:hypothetical protein BDK51DRAFT_26419 [Blyttiomyces helicus]|uniref:Uncharacterized protein n=1 Tax=Blyttiomyces helicus TaxID=388810 RepID=A0A4P9WJ24_9FUNG|nr:hypothetical protein BDK51DRAFT_26419 [Blyttiomyces helicus]|eukprot:RKO92911.1 hypothetical protein BDK51DRAFT_26419 [Blyttiomyces helicus]